MMLPSDMHPLNAPAADACNVRGNQRDITLTLTGTSPACATPINAREPVITSAFPSASPAVTGAITDAPSRSTRSISGPRRALQGALRAAAEPQRDISANRPRCDPGTVDAVERALEVDDWFAPQPAQHVDLLVEAATAAGERRSEALVLHVVPTGAHRDHDAATGEHVDLRRLFGDQRRGPLR